MLGMCLSNRTNLFLSALLDYKKIQTLCRTSVFCVYAYIPAHTTYTVMNTSHLAIEGAYKIKKDICPKELLNAISF